MNHIKTRRLEKCKLSSLPGLFVGECVPFYFCPRSVMLYLFYKGDNLDLEYRGGQNPIVHLEASLYETIAWAEQNGKRWAFTTSNAGSLFFEDYADLEQLDKIDWAVVVANNWQGRQDKKQAEFLVEYKLPWNLITRIGVKSNETRQLVLEAMEGSTHRPPVETRPAWYY